MNGNHKGNNKSLLDHNEFDSLYLHYWKSAGDNTPSLITFWQAVTKWKHYFV